MKISTFLGHKLKLDLDNRIAEAKRRIAWECFSIIFHKDHSERSKCLKFALRYRKCLNQWIRQQTHRGKDRCTLYQNYQEYIPRSRSKVHQRKSITNRRNWRWIVRSRRKLFKSLHPAPNIIRLKIRLHTCTANYKIRKMRPSENL